MPTLDLVEKDGSLNEEAVKTFLDSKNPQTDAAAVSPPAAPDTEIPAPGDVREPAAGDEPAAKADEPLSEHWASSEKLAATAEIVAVLGLTEAQIKEFGSEDEFDRYVRFRGQEFVRQGAALAQRSGQPPQAEPVPDADRRPADERSQRVVQQPRERGRFVKADTEPDDEVYEPGDAVAQNWGEDMAGELGKVGQHLSRQRQEIRDVQSTQAKLQDVLNRAEARERAAVQNEMIRQFDAVVNNLGDEELFGNSKPASKDSPQHKARERLLVDGVLPLLTGLESQGRPAAITFEMVRWARNAVFAEELKQRHRKEFVADLRNQSKRTLPSGSMPSRTAPTTVPEARKAAARDFENLRRSTGS